MVPGPTATATFRPNPCLLNLISDYEWLPVVSSTGLARSSLVRSYEALVLRYSEFLPNIIPQEHRVTYLKVEYSWNGTRRPSIS